MLQQGKTSRLEDYSLQATAAEKGKFMRSIKALNTPLEKITYALHF